MKRLVVELRRSTAVDTQALRKGFSATGETYAYGVAKEPAPRAYMQPPASRVGVAAPGFLQATMRKVAAVHVQGGNVYQI